MNRAVRIVLAIATLVIIGGVVAGIALLPDDEEVRLRLSAELQRRSPVHITLGSVHWRLLPTPALTVTNIRSRQPEPVVIERLTAYPGLRAFLLRGRLEIDRLQIDGARIPTASLRAFRREEPAGRPAPSVDGIPLHSVRFRNLIWISRTGVGLPLEGDIDFQRQWRPGSVRVRRPGFTPATTLDLVRSGRLDEWRVTVALGGGSADGSVRLTETAERGLQVTGELAPRNIDVAVAAASLKRRSPIGGKANGRTRVGAAGRTAGDLGSSLRLRSEVKVAAAQILRIDVDHAIRTLGRERAGTTRLKSLDAVMDIQNTPEGTVTRYREIVAVGDTFTATGDATVFNRRVEGEGKIKVLKDAVEIPFHVSGPTRKVDVSVPPGVVAGAVAGTLLFPVVGTVVGAKIGAAAHDPDAAPAAPPGTPQFVPTPLSVQAP
ncbi:MAG: hypothetical protein ABIX37_12250 [Gammaproteobacteria bacterium]